MIPDNFKPVVPVVKPDDCYALGFQHGGLPLVPLLALRIVVGGAIYINKGGVLPGIGKIRPRLIRFIKMLGTRWETEGIGFKEIEEFALQPRIAQTLQLLKVGGPRHLDGGNDHIGIPEFNEKITDQVPVKDGMVRLIVIAQEAIIAGRLAVLLGVFCFTEV